MKLLMCHCSMCKRGRRCRHGHEPFMKQKIKCAKSKVRAMLRKGEYEKLPVAIAIGYTD